MYLDSSIPQTLLFRNYFSERLTPTHCLKPIGIAVPFCGVEIGILSLMIGQARVKHIIYSGQLLLVQNLQYVQSVFRLSRERIPVHAASAIGQSYLSLGVIKKLAHITDSAI
jgi:hypothetical protein